MINEANQYLTKIVPICLAQMNKGSEMIDWSKNSDWEGTLREVLQKMDGGEFNVFLAQVVIKSSGQGITGVTLTEGVAWLKELRLS